MIRALQLIFSPASTWEKIALANRGFAFVLFLYLLPLVLGTTAIEELGMCKWGETRNEFGNIVLVTRQMAVTHGLVSAGLGLFLVLLASRFLLTVARSFHSPASYTQAFTTLAYGLSPIFLARIIDALPGIHTWVCWIIGTVVSLGLLYHGVALIMKPEQTKGFGLYIFTMVFVTVLGGLSHFLALSILHGRFFHY